MKYFKDLPLLLHVMVSTQVELFVNIGAIENLTNKYILMHYMWHICTLFEYNVFVLYKRDVQESVYSTGNHKCQYKLLIN